MVILPKRILASLASLAILVVGCAQVFGMQRGFVCDHQGTRVETTAEHCHHEAETGFVSCAEDVHEEDVEHEDTKHHAPLTVDLQAGTAGLTAVSIPAFVAVLVAEISRHEWVLIEGLTVNEMMKTPMETGGESPPPAALQVVRCVVILV